jgi:ABC-type transport system involved in cytochrome bd biosynthesis fused ATPase/permease subunit
MVTRETSFKDIDINLYAESLRISSLQSWGDGRIGELTNENISGGERKQIALARAIYSQPEILLLDEVTAGMDQNLAELILRNVRASEILKLVVIASHDQLQDLEFDKIIVLS